MNTATREFEPAKFAVLCHDQVGLPARSKVNDIELGTVIQSFECLYLVCIVPIIRKLHEKRTKLIARRSDDDVNIICGSWSAMCRARVRAGHHIRHACLFKRCDEPLEEIINAHEARVCHRRCLPALGVFRDPRGEDDDRGRRLSRTHAPSRSSSSQVEGVPQAPEHHAACPESQRPWRMYL